MSITLESLGFTKEELQQRVIDQLCEQLLSSKEMDEYGNEDYTSSRFKKQIDEKIKTHIAAQIDAIAQTHVLPNVTSYVENLVLQQTTKWGEKKGAPVTFIEYLIARAHDYIMEEVNYEGKSKEEAGSYNWNKATTRIAYLVNRHLQYNIETAMKQALTTANSAIVGGLEQAVKIKLQEVVNGMKVAVTTK